MSHSCQSRGGCRQQCPEYRDDVELPAQPKTIRFFVIVGVATTVMAVLIVILTCLYPGVVLPAIAAFFWVLGRLLGKEGLS